MPELPEVETVRKTLEKLVKGKTIANCRIFWPRIVRHPDVQQFCRLLEGETIRDLRRRGKYLIFVLDHFVFLAHLRMEGRFQWQSQLGSRDPHVHAEFYMTDKSVLLYRDVRKFGTFHLFEKGTELNRLPLAALGPEPLEESFTAEALYHQLRKKKQRIKAALLDQKVVAGLGNIYVDEALFKAGIYPAKPACHLTESEIASLHRAIVVTLREAVACGGSSVRTYLNGNGETGLFQLKLFVYGRMGEPCRRCGAMIEKLKVAGRGTHICPRCQGKEAPRWSSV